MKIDFTRLLIVMVILTLVQRILPGILVSVGLDNIYFVVIVIDFVSALIIVYANIPTRFWKEAHRWSMFHKMLVMYFLIFLVLSALNLFIL